MTIEDIRGLHSLLQRQLKKHLPAGEIPADWIPFVQAVERAYRQSDVDREMLERSLELSSQELLQANTELRAVLRAFPDLVFRLKADGRILDIKGADAARLQELVGRRFQDAPAEDARLALRAALDAAVTQRTSTSVEYALTTADRSRIFEARLVPLPGGDLLAIVRDITARRATERALQDSERQLAEAQRVAHVGSFEWDIPSNKMTWSAEFFRLLDLDPATSPATMESARKATHPADHKLVASVIKARYKDQDTFTANTRAVMKNGSLRIIHWRGNVVAHDGVPLLMFGTVQDVTDLKNAEDALKRAHDQLETRVEERTAALEQAQERLRQAQKMEAIGTLAGGIAHDFNNILGAIMGSAELALMDAAGNEPVAKSLNDVLTASRRATHLVQQILAFSRQQKRTREVVDPGPVVEETLRLLRASLPASIEIRARLDADTPTVLADATELHQVMMNLGTNAWHAMAEKGGVLEVTLSAVDADAALAAAHINMRPGRYARLSVRDTGHGMSRAVLERIFDPFFTTKAPGRGSGLGLATVHGIVGNHDGAVGVRSQIGEGTTFDVYFPAFAAPAPAQVGAPSRPIPLGRGQHVAFVDDEDALAQWGRDILQRLGYRVTGFTDPSAALRAVTSAPEGFDLVVTDLTMPMMSGLDLARELLATRPGLPIILTTGHTHDLTEERIHQLGIRELLAKPNSVEMLAHAVHRALDGSAGA